MIAPFGVRIAVLLMVAGSVVAALYDLTFNLLGYTYILFNDICTASQGVYMKKKLDAKVGLKHSSPAFVETKI